MLQLAQPQNTLIEFAEQLSRALTDILSRRRLKHVSAREWDDARDARPVDPAVHWGWVRNVGPHEDWALRAGSEAQRVRQGLQRMPVDTYTLICIEVGLLQPQPPYPWERLSMTVRVI